MALSGYSLRLYSFVSILASTGNSMGIVNKHSFGVLFLMKDAEMSYTLSGVAFKWRKPQPKGQESVVRVY